MARNKAYRLPVRRTYAQRRAALMRSAASASLNLSQHGGSVAWRGVSQLSVSSSMA